MAVPVGRDRRWFSTKAAATYRINSRDAKAVRQRSLTDFCICCKKHEDRRLEEVYGSKWDATTAPVDWNTAQFSVQKAAIAENQANTGGYLVPMDYTLRLMEVLIEESFIYPLATIVPMMSREMQVPKIDVETAQSAGTPPYFGGMKYTWGSEQVVPETEPTFRNLPLCAWDLTGYTKISNQFFQDIGDAGEEYLINLIAKAASWFTEYAFLQGTGSAALMPMGVVNAPGAVQVSATTGGAIVIADIVNMTKQLLPYSWKNAVWATHPSTLVQIQQLGSSGNQYFINIELGRERHGSQAGMLSTRPLFVTDKLPALGTSSTKNQGCLILFDPTLYVIGDRQQILIDISEHNQFQTYQTLLRAWVRLDGKPMVSKAMTLTDGTFTASPYVVLSA